MTACFALVAKRRQPCMLRVPSISMATNTFAMNLDEVYAALQLYSTSISGCLGARKMPRKRCLPFLTLWAEKRAALILSMPFKAYSECCALSLCSAKDVRS